MAKTIFSSFEDFYQQAGRQAPAWLKASASQAAQNISRDGIPDRSSEEWKYTDLGFMQNFRGQIADAQDFAVPLVPFAALSKEQIQEWESLRTQLNTLQADGTMENLNLALSNSGGYLRVKKNTLQNLSLVFEAQKQNTWRSPRLAIFVEENAQLVVEENYAIGEGEVINSFYDVHLADGAQLLFVRHQDSHQNSNHVSTIRVLQNSNSQFKYFNFFFGSKVARDNVLVLLDGEGAHCELKGLNAVRSGQHMDQFVFVDHKTPRATSTQIFKNVISNRSRAVFNGRVLVRKGSVGTDARQLNKNLLLGKLAEIDTRPQLEIFNDDVKCSHGATIGRLNADELFYLESRGISRKQGIDMLCRAFVEELVYQLLDDNLRQKIVTTLNRHFKELESDYGNT